MAQTTHIRVFYINNGEHDNPYELPRENSEDSLNTDNAVYTYLDLETKLPEEIRVYFSISKIVKHETDPHIPMEHTNDTLYPQINNDIKYSLFENIIDSYYLVTQIRDDFTCTKACYVHNDTNNILETRP